MLYLPPPPAGFTLPPLAPAQIARDVAALLGAVVLGVSLAVLPYVLGAGA